jgi:hypothetical protein
MEEDRWEAQTQKKMSSNYIGVKNNKNALIKQDGGGWMESSYPEKCHPITLT